MSAEFISNRAAVEAEIRVKTQAGALAAAHDLLAVSTPKTPYKRGDLRSRRRASVLSNGARAEWLARYAAVQEAGRRGGHTFRKYTTPGTGAHFVENAVKVVKQKMQGYFKW
jgi:hypothetical protein